MYRRGPGLRSNKNERVILKDHHKEFILKKSGYNSERRIDLELMLRAITQLKQENEFKIIIGYNGVKILKIDTREIIKSFYDMDYKDRKVGSIRSALCDIADIIGGKQ